MYTILTCCNTTCKIHVMYYTGFDHWDNKSSVTVEVILPQIPDRGSQQRITFIA